MYVRTCTTVYYSYPCECAWLAWAMCEIKTRTRCAISLASVSIFGWCEVMDGHKYSLVLCTDRVDLYACVCVSVFAFVWLCTMCKLFKSPSLSWIAKWMVVPRAVSTTMHSWIYGNRNEFQNILTGSQLTCMHLIDRMSSGRHWQCFASMMWLWNAFACRWTTQLRSSVVQRLRQC